MAKKIKSGRIRLSVQILFFVIVTIIATSHSLEKAGINIPFLPSASLHAVCPFGGVVSIYEVFISGNFVKKIHESSFILMFIVFGLAIFLGPVFCGWVCPLGSFQEWIGKLGKKLFKKKYNNIIPYKIDKILRFIRYIVLFQIVKMTAQSAELLFVNIDPYYALFNFWTGEVAVTALIVLGVVIVASFFIERPFCKF